jgi:transposase
VDEEGGEFIRGVLAEAPDLTLKELCERYEGRFGRAVSKSSMDRALRRLKVTRKKSLLRPKAKERACPTGACGLSRGITDLKGGGGHRSGGDGGGYESHASIWAFTAGGAGVWGQAHGAGEAHQHGRRCSRLSGLKTVMCFEGTLTGAVFLQFLDEFLVPVLKPGQIVILDNAKAHKVAGVRERMEGAGARVLYLPPYSPDLNPLEMAWSKVKQFLRKAQARTVEALYEAIAQALQTLSPTDAKGFFKHVGFCI